MKIEAVNGSSATSGSKKPIDRVETLEKEVSNLNMALRVSQVLLKQTIEQLEELKSASRQNMSMINDFQYRLLGLQSATNVNVADVAAKADELKLVDWSAASDAEDVAGGFTTSSRVDSDQDTVILTSTTPDTSPDTGIFRSRATVAEIGNKELIEALIGKSVGDKFEFNLNGSKHIIELLGVRVKQTTQPNET